MKAKISQVCFNSSNTLFIKRKSICLEFQLKSNCQYFSSIPQMHTLNFIHRLRNALHRRLFHFTYWKLYRHGVVFCNKFVLSVSRTEFTTTFRVNPAKYLKNFPVLRMDAIFILFLIEIQKLENSRKTTYSSQVHLNN